jgi:hypothetical protein
MSYPIPVYYGVTDPPTQEDETMMTAAEWLTSDKVTDALARIKHEEDEAMSIQEWFDTNDKWFEKPIEALAAGFTILELAGEYERVFGSFGDYRLTKDWKDFVLGVGAYKV